MCVCVCMCLCVFPLYCSPPQRGGALPENVARGALCGPQLSRGRCGRAPDCQCLTRTLTRSPVSNHWYAPGTQVLSGRRMSILRGVPHSPRGTHSRREGSLGWIRSYPSSPWRAYPQEAAAIHPRAVPPASPHAGDVHGLISAPAVLGLMLAAVFAATMSTVSAGYVPN